MALPTASVRVPASGLRASGRRVSSRAWTSSAVTTWSLIRALSGSMTAGSARTLPARFVKRSVFSTTWCVHTATVVSRINRLASTRATPARIRRDRLGAAGAVACASVFVITPSNRSTLRAGAEA